MASHTGGCEGGSVCLAKGSGQYDSPACVSQSGTVACPGGFPELIEAYSGTTDTRGCSQCECASNTLSCEGSKFTIWDVDGCASGGADDIDIPVGSCVGTEPYVDNNACSYRATIGALAGSCATSGGEPTGELVPDGAVTYCCLSE